MSKRAETLAERGQMSTANATHPRFTFVAFVSFVMAVMFISPDGRSSDE
jgi:hypothetical protein